MPQQNDIPIPIMKVSPVTINNYVRRIVYIKVIAEGDALAAGDGQAYFTVPDDLDGFDLVDAAACVYTASTLNDPTVQIHNLTDTVDMLTTEITIDATELNSYTATAPAVIDAANDDVATGDVIRIDVDEAGTNTTGLDIILIFERP